MDRLFNRLSTLTWQESPEYYLRYRTRYEAVLTEIVRTVTPSPARILEVGGGQLAMLSQWIWGDSGSVADITDTCFPALQENGIACRQWNLARDDTPFSESFDIILLSEVIEHLPVPGHIALAKLKALLSPGGSIIVTTPNLYRLRNVAFLMLGRPIFDHFDLPSDRGFGHVLEYSREHLDWQLNKAGFVNYQVYLRDFRHVPNRRSDQVLAALGKPLLLLPRFRDNLIAVAREG